MKLSDEYLMRVLLMGNTIYSASRYLIDNGYIGVGVSSLEKRINALRKLNNCNTNFELGYLYGRNEIKYTN